MRGRGRVEGEVGGRGEKLRREKKVCGGPVRTFTRKARGEGGRDGFVHNEIKDLRMIGVCVGGGLLCVVYCIK